MITVGRMFQKNFSRRRRIVTPLVAGVLALPVTVAAVGSTTERPVEAARNRATKFEVCHRTNAIKNPYRLISVAWSSVDPNGNGHDNPVHDGPVFDIANPVATHGTTPRDTGLGNDAGGGNDRWGDIFNAYKGPGNGNSNSNNWTTAGQAIFNGATFTINGVTKAACRKMTTAEYIDSEREEDPNIPMSDIMAELDEMGATDDEATKQALGGSFTTWHQNCTQNCNDATVIKSSIAAAEPTVATDNPTSVAQGSSSTSGAGTLNGTANPNNLPLECYFEFDDDQDFTPSGSDSTDVQEVAATPGTIPANTNTPVTMTHNATSLDTSKTYYYRVVCVSSSGSGDSLVETYLYGVTKQFSFTGSTPTTTTLPPTTNANATGGIAGTVWIDADADDTKDASEVWIPGIVVKLAGTSSATATTSASGSFTFTNLAPGSYTVTAVLPSGLGLNISWDSQGNSDWVAVVTVVSGQTAKADFAAIGNVEVVGQARNVPPGTEVNVDWSGIDKELDTPDDVTYTTKLSTNRTFEIQSVPTGKYRVRIQSARVNLTVNSAGATYDNGNISIVAKAAVIPATGLSLPSTMLPLSLALVSSGALVMWMTRRRRVA